jgi:hypothetical protein
VFWASVVGYQSGSATSNVVTAQALAMRRPSTMR